jgi:hypothetical protein
MFYPITGVKPHTVEINVSFLGFLRHVSAIFHYLFTLYSRIDHGLFYFRKCGLSSYDTQIPISTGSIWILKGDSLRGYRLARDIDCLFSASM